MKLCFSHFWQKGFVFLQTSGSQINDYQKVEKEA